MTAAEDFDAITVERLRQAGSLKWAAFPQHLGAWVAEMDFGTAPPVADALNKAVAKASFGYLPQKLAADMAESCSRWMQNHYGWDVPAANIRPLPDVLAGLAVCMEHFSAPGSKVILPTPAYMPFFKLPGTQRRDIIEVPMVRAENSWELDYDALDQAFRDGGGLLVMCNPHNPIGKVYTRAEMSRVAEIVDRHAGRVFADEVHAPLMYDGGTHVPYASVSSAAAGHTVTATSASKAWNLPGLKTAQIVFSNAADLAVWDAVSFFYEHGASTLGVVANTAAYMAGGPWLAEVVSYLAGNRALLGQLLAEQLPAVKYIPPQGTYLALLDFRGLGLGDHPARFFADNAGVALIDGAECGVAGRGFARLNFATPRPVLQRIIEQMAAAVDSR